MKKVLTWGAIICVSLTVIVIAALVIVALVVDVNKYKPEIERLVSENTQRPFSIGDDLNFTLFPWAGISLSDIRLGNTSGFSEKNFVTAKSFEVRLKLLPLIFKEIEVKRMVLNEPRIVLVKSKTGAVNWEFPATGGKSDKKAEGPAGEPSATGLPISSLVVNDFSIKNGAVLWMDLSTEMRREVTDINLAVKDVSLEHPVKVAFSALLDERPVSIDGSVGPVGSALSGGNVSLDLTVKALRELSMMLKGNIENPMASPAVDMHIDVANFSPRKLLAALDLPFPLETADPKALNRVALKARVKATSKAVSISSATLDLDDSKMDFSMNASDFSRPNLKFDLDLDQIDLDRYLPTQSEKASPAGQPTTGETSKKKEKMDYTPLRRLIMDGQIKIGKLTVSKAKMQDIYLKVTARNGIINLDPMKLDMYEGNVAGKAALNVETDTPQSALNLNVKNLKINPLLRDVAQKDILEGATNAQLSLSMAGDDAALIKKTLNGKGELVFNDGAIIGIDLAGMVRNAKAAFGLGQKTGERPRTDFTELAAPFTITNGLVNTPQTSLKSPLLRVIAAGDADLVRETLDLRVEPKVVGTIKGQGDEIQRSGFTVPVVISGTFAAPKFRPDLESAAAQKLQQQLLESEEVKKTLDKEELEPVKKKAKGLLKGVLNN